MKHQWTNDLNFPDDFDLSVLDEEGHWVTIAFIRWHPTEKHYKCMFLDMDDDEFPDGQTFKTKRGAQRFCVRQLPVMWIKHNTKGVDE